MRNQSRLLRSRLSLRAWGMATSSVLTAGALAASPAVAQPESSASEVTAVQQKQPAKDAGVNVLVFHGPAAQQGDPVAQATATIVAMTRC